MPMKAPGFIMYVAGQIELVGGFLVMVGFMTRWAAFLCSGLMGVAYWMRMVRKVYSLSKMAENLLYYIALCSYLFLHKGRVCGAWMRLEGRR